MSDVFQLLSRTLMMIVLACFVTSIVTSPVGAACPTGPLCRDVPPKGGLNHNGNSLDHVLWP